MVQESELIVDGVYVRKGNERVIRSISNKKVCYAAILYKNRLYGLNALEGKCSIRRFCRWAERKTSTLNSGWN